MSFCRSAAVPVALAVVCAATPALAHGRHHHTHHHHLRHSTATSVPHGQAPQPAAPQAAHSGLLAAMAAGAAMKPGDIVPATPSAIGLGQPQSAETTAPSKVHRKHRLARRHGIARGTTSAQRTPATHVPPLPQPAPEKATTQTVVAQAPSKQQPAQHDATPTAASMAGMPHPRLRAIVARYAKEEGIPFALAHGVVMVESRYRPHATGHGGYIGLMQLSYSTARSMGFHGSRAALYKPETNIRYGVHYLAEAYRLSGGKLCATVSKYQGGTAVHGVTRAGARYCGRVRHFMARLKRNDVQLADAKR